MAEPNYMTVRSMPVQAMGARTGGSRRKKRDWTDEDFQESRRRYGAYLAQEIDFNQRHGSHLTDEDVRIRAEERLRQDGLPTAQESQLRADLDSINLSGYERFGVRAHRAQLATINSLRKRSNMTGLYTDALEAAADKATQESSGVLEDFVSEGAGMVTDPVWLATYGAGRVLQAGKYASMAPWKKEIVKDVVAGVPADFGTSMIQTGGDVQQSLSNTGTGAAFAVGGGIVLRGLAKALRVASPNITPEKIRADATKALLRDPEAISEINRLRGTGLSAREAEQTVLSGLDDQLTRALDPEQGTVRGLLDAKRQGMQTYDQYVAKLQEASDAETRGLMAQINESIYDVDYQRAGVLAADNLENRRILQSELNARKADAAADEVMADVAERRAREIADDPFIYNEAEKRARLEANRADLNDQVAARELAERRAREIAGDPYIYNEAGKQARLDANRAALNEQVAARESADARARAIADDPYIYNEDARQARLDAARAQAAASDPMAPIRRAREIVPDSVIQESRAIRQAEQDAALGQMGVAMYGVRKEAGRQAELLNKANDIDAEVPSSQVDKFYERAEKTTALRGDAPVQELPNARPEVEADVAARQADDAIRSEAYKDPDTFELINELEGMGYSRAQAEAIAIPELDTPAPRVEADAPTRPVEGASGEQLQMFRSGIAPDDIAAMVSDAIAAGKWTAKQAIIGARWALEVGGDAIKTMRDFAGVMLDKFGRGIRKHIPEMWQKFKQFRERRAAMRQQTARRRQFGGIDLRSNKVPKNAQQQIASKARAEAKAVAREQRADREANRAMADMGVKERLPMSERGKFLTRVRKANTANRVNKTLIQADRARAKLEKDLAIEKSRKELLKQIKGRKDSPIRIAAQNSEFADDFNRIHALGVKDPRKGPTLGELRRMDDGQRAAVVRAYADIEAKFLKSRADVHVGEEVTDAARGIAKEVNGLGRKEMKVTDGATGERNASLLKQVGREESLQPERLVERLGKRAMAEIYNPIAESKGNYYKTVKSFNEELTARLKQAGIADPENGKWLNSVSGPRANKRTVKLDGQDVTFTDGQFWSLLANLTDPQTRKLVEGGAPISLANDTTRRFKIDEDGLRTILASSTEQDRAVVKAIKEVYNGTSKDRLNKTWRELFGKDLATHDDYFPRMRDVEKTIDDIEEVMRPAQDGTLEGRSLAKERTENPDAPVVIGDILSTSDKHFAQVSAIVEMAPAVRKVRAILGNREFKDATVRSYGDSMHRAIDTWVQDVIEEAGGFRRPMTPTQVTLGKLVSNTAVGVLGVNPWVILKQLPSFGNAMTEIDPRYMLQGAKDAIMLEPRAVRDRMFEHSPQIWARYKVHASRLIGDMRNATPIQRTSKDLSDKLMAGISWADQNVIASIWRASELKVKAEQPNLKGDDYWKAVNDQADRVIRRTQPNFDSVNTSSIQRKGKGDPFMKAASMFMSQRNTNYNMLYSALASKDPKKIAAILGVVAIAQPLMISGVDETRDWMYGRQEHESGGDLALSLATDVVANNFSQVYFAGPILDPATRGVSNAISDKNNYIFPPSNPITSTANGIQEGIAKLLDGTIDGDGERAWDGFERAMLSAAALGGVPIRSPYRFAEELIERYNEADQED